MTIIPALRNFCKVCIFTTVVFGNFVFVFAQEEESNEASSRVLEPVTVTAQFRDQRLQEVPNAINAFTEQDILDAGIRSTEDFIALTPNVTFDDSFTYLNSFVVIRGVTQINNADSPVAVIVDGVPQNNQKQFKMPLFDVQQIEVLKGPQGALYGRNAIGGAINIVTKQPTDEIERFVRGEIGNGGSQQIQAGISGPISEDTLTFRLSGNFLKSDGLIENVYLKKEVDYIDSDLALRGKLTYKPNEVFTLDFRGSFSEATAGSSYDAVVNSTNNTNFRSGNDSNEIFSPTSSLEGITEAKINEITGVGRWELDSASVTYILGLTELTEKYRADLDFSNNRQGTFGSFGELGQGQNLDVKLTSHEIRVVSHDDTSVRWLGGIYLLDTERDLLTRGFIDANSRHDQFEKGTAIITRNEANTNTAWAMFGQVEIDISEDISLQLGGRYDEDKRKQVIPGTDNSSRSTKFDSFQPKLTLGYRFEENLLGYATYSTGFRSGGYNAPGVALTDFGDELLKNYEVGVKSDFGNGRGVLNAAFFMSNSEGFQFFFVDVATVSQIIANLDEVSLSGFDIDFRFVATDNIVLYGGIGNTNSEIKSIGSDRLKEFLTASSVDLNKVKGARSPKNTGLMVNFGGQYDTVLENGMKVSLRADYEYQGKKYWQIDNIDVRDPITLLSLRAGVSRDNWQVVFWGKNLLDEEYYADFNPSEYAGAPFDLGFQARPRTLGVELSYEF